MATTKAATEPKVLTKPKAPAKPKLKAIEHKRLALDLLEPNTGQIKGLFPNPRLVRDAKYQNLIASLREDPELLGAQPLIVVPRGRKFVVIAGNRRRDAAIELQWTDVPCAVVDPKTPIDKLKAYAIKTNISYGEWDWEVLAAANISNAKLTAFGLDLPELFGVKSSPATAAIAAPTARVDEFGQFAVPVTVNQEKIIRTAVNQAKKTYGVTHSGSALAAICEEWITLKGKK